MPTIPTLERRTVTPSSRVTNVGVADIGSVGRELGGAIDRTRARVDEAAQKKTRYELADAKSKFGILMHQQNNAYEQDSDYDTIPQRWGEGVRSGADELLAGVSDPEARNMLQMEIDERIAASKPHIDQLAFGKKREVKRADLFAQMEANREVFLGKDSELAKSAAANMMELIQVSVDEGFLTKEAGDEAYRTWKEDAAVGRLNMFDPEDQLLALDDPLIKDNIKSDTMAKLRRGVEGKILDKQARTIVDGFGQDFSLRKLYAEADKIEDYSLSQKVKSYGETRFKQQNNVKLEDDQEFHDEYVSKVLLGDIDLEKERSSSWYKDLPPKRRVLLEKADTASKTPRKHTDIDVLDNLTRLYSKEKFPELRKYYENNLDKLSASDQAMWSKVTWKGLVPEEWESKFTTVSQINSELAAAGMSNTLVKDHVLSNVNNWDEQQIKAGNKVTDSDRLQKIKDSIAEVDLNPDGWFREKKRFYELSREDRDTLVDKTLKYPKKVSDSQFNVVMRTMLEDSEDTQQLNDAIGVAAKNAERLTKPSQEIMLKRIYEFDEETANTVYSKLMNTSGKIPTPIEFIRGYDYVINGANK